MKTSADSAISDTAYALALDIYRLTQKAFRNGPDALGDELRQTALRVVGHLRQQGAGHRDEARAAAARMEALLVTARELEYLVQEDFRRLRAGYQEIAAGF